MFMHICVHIHICMCIYLLRLDYPAWPNYFQLAISQILYHYRLKILYLGLGESSEHQSTGCKSRDPEFISQATHVKSCMATCSCNPMSLGGDRLHHVIYTPCQLLWMLRRTPGGMYVNVSLNL